MASRRAVGEGSVYRRRDNDGKEIKDAWVAQITVGGKRKTFTGKTRKEATAKLDEYKKSAEFLSPTAGAEMKLEDFMTEWMSSVKRRTLKDTSYDIHMVWDNGRTLGIIPGEDNFRKLISEIETMKLYMPLSARVYGFNEFGETNDAYTGMSDREFIDFKDNIVAAIKNNELPEEGERGLMQWYHDDDEVNKKVLSVRPSVEIVDGRLMGVMECCIKSVLNDAEIKNLKDYVSGQTSDGWGEGFEQRPVKTEEGEIYVSFWNSAPGWKICTEKELQTQRQSFSEMSL